MCGFTLLAHLSFRRGRDRQRMQHGRCMWSLGCMKLLHSHRCFQSSPVHSNRWHTHKRSCPSGCCRYLRSGKCLAEAGTRPRLLYSADLWRGKKIEDEENVNFNICMLTIMCRQIFFLTTQKMHSIITIYNPSEHFKISFKSFKYLALRWLCIPRLA